MTPRQITNHKRRVLVCIKREEAKRSANPAKPERKRRRYPRKRIRWDMQ